MTSLRHSTQIDHVENFADYPDFLQKLVPLFKKDSFLRFIQKTGHLGSIKLNLVHNAVLRAILGYMRYDEALLSPCQIRCFPSVKTIIEVGRSCERSTRCAIRRFEDGGFLEIIESVNPQTGKNNSNTYKVTKLCFFEWALSQVEHPEEKTYIQEQIEKFLSTKKPTRLSIVQGKKGFLTRKSNEVREKLFSAFMAVREKFPEFQEEFAAIDQEEGQLLSFAKETDSADIQLPARLEPSARILKTPKNASAVATLEMQNYKEIASISVDPMGSKNARQTTNSYPTDISNKITTTSTAENPEEKLEADVPISSGDMEELIGAYTATMGRKVPKNEQKLFVSKMLNVGTSVEGDIVKFSGWRHQAASSTLSPSSNLHFMLMTSAKS